MTRLTMTLAAALAATLMAGPVMAACTATITETGRWSDYGLGEPADGNGITQRSAGHVVREGANFDIEYNIVATCGLLDTPQVTVSISGGASNWDVFGSLNGTKNSAQHINNGPEDDGTNPEWKNWKFADSTYTIPWTLSGTTTDDNCHGGIRTAPLCRLA